MVYSVYFVYFILLQINPKVIKNHLPTTSSTFSNNARDKHTQLMWKGNNNKNDFIANACVSFKSVLEDLKLIYLKVNNI